MTVRVDLLIRNQKGQILAVVEIKNRQDIDLDMATAFRRNMIVHGLVPEIPFFLLLSQDIGFVWKGTVNPDAPPAYQFPMNNVVARYLPGLAPGERLKEVQLELVLLQWLTDLAEEPQIALEEPEKSLALSGFLESIRGATVLSEVQF
jgi:hypothetical protein